jgi:hypothetical protein
MAGLCTHLGRLAAKQASPAPGAWPTAPRCSLYAWPDPQHHRRCWQAGAAKSGAGTAAAEDSALPSLAKSLLRDVVTAVAPSATTRSPTTDAPSALPEDLRSPTYALAAVNVAAFLLGKSLLPAAALHFAQHAPKWWQPVTALFAHATLDSALMSVFFM